MATKKEIDQLKEITNIGAGNAATALSHMLGKRVEMSVPESYVGNIVEIQRILGSKQQEVYAVYFKIFGDIDGAMLMLFLPQAALDFIKLLNGERKANLRDLTAFDKSALMELGNILLGASVTAFGKFLNLNILHTIPDESHDELGAVMDSVLLEISKEQEQILAFRVNLKVELENMGGDLYYLFDPKSSNKIFKATQQKI